jgi:hypothetical protein
MLAGREILLRSPACEAVAPTNFVDERHGASQFWRNIGISVRFSALWPSKQRLRIILLEKELKPFVHHRSSSIINTVNNLKDSWLTGLVLDLYG